MFEPLAKNREITFQTVRELCAQFQTSLTATAIRLVELGSFPSVIVCNNRQRRLWAVRDPDVPNAIQLKDTPGAYTNAYELLHGETTFSRPGETEASDWITHPRSRYYSIYEDSVKVNDDIVLSLLWWKDEKQLLDLDDDEYEEY